jgi:type VI protein secretion system component VasK
VPRWAFAWELFSVAILGDDAVGRPYGNRRFDLYRIAGCGVSAAALVAFGVLAVRSWVRSDRFVTDLRNTVTQLPVARGAEEVPGRLAPLEHLRDSIQTLRAYRDSGPPWVSVWLYPGQTLVEPVRNFYFRRFHQYLLADTEKAFITGLNSVPDVLKESFSYESVYSQLKGYLSITTKSCEPDAAFLTDVWRSSRPIEKDLAFRQFAFFVHEHMPIPLGADYNVISRGRGYLNKFDFTASIYRSTLDQAARKLKPARLPDYTQHADVLKGDSEVRAAFTRDGAKAILERIDRAALGTDSCVFDRESPGGINDDQLKQRLRNMYIREYIDAWRRYLASLAVIPYRGPKDAATNLSVLTENDSAILAALYMTSEHTTFPDESSDGRNTPSLVPADRAQKAATVPIQPSVPDKLVVADITKLFQPAHRLFQDDATRARFISGRNQPYLDGLRALQHAMDRLAQANSSQEANIEAANAYRSGLNTVKNISYDFDRNDVANEVQRFLEDPIRKCQKLFTEDYAKAERDRLQAGVRKLCEEVTTLRKKRPFNPRAQEEATEKDVVRFFAFHDGVLWKLEQANLEPLMVKQNGLWVQRPDGGQNQVRLSSQFLDYFNRLASISGALFPPDGTRLGSEYTIKVAKPVNVDGLSLDAGSGEVPGGQYPLKWPADRFRVKVTPGSPLADFEGLWSLFNMASRATHKGGGVLELSCVYSVGAGSRCNTNTGKDGKDVIVQIQVVKPPNGIERSLDPGFLEVDGGCPIAVRPSGTR